MILQEILASKSRELRAVRERVSLLQLRGRPLYAERRRGFAECLKVARGRRVIAEIKRMSPSRGVIREDFAPERHAADYQAAGATCISVLTDGPYFGGSLEDLARVRRACALPLLRKDFVVDAYQVVEARAFGADAVLLIVAVLDDRRLPELLAAAGEEGLDALVEVHSTDELSAAMAAGASLIGINNRNLETFETNTGVTRRLLPLVERPRLVVSESGLGDGAELADLEAAGVDAFLIGESLMRADHPGEALARLLRT